MSLENGIVHLASWAGNVIMPTVAGLLVVGGIVQFSRGRDGGHLAYASLVECSINCST
jgi:hypothetical protein